jgi:hypothetical protein
MATPTHHRGPNPAPSLIWIIYEESADSLAAQYRAATVRERIGCQSYILWYSHAAIRSLTVAAPLALRISVRLFKNNPA